MSDRLLYISSQLQCTVLEVKVVDGIGTTVDVILGNGVLREGDAIVLCGMQGPIVTSIRALLMPKPLREIRVKSEYDHHKMVIAAQGVKIMAQDLEGAVAGSSLYVYNESSGPSLEELKDLVMEDLQGMMSNVDKSGRGVYVQASTLGSLEALLVFLRESEIPVSGIGIGPIHKKDVTRASVMLEHQPEFAIILAFDVRITTEGKEMAQEMGVRIFSADIIYHLFDMFTGYMEELKQAKKEDASKKVVFPCRMKIIPDYVFNTRDPIVVGVDILDGILRVGTPLVIPSKGMLDIGKVDSIEFNKNKITEAKKGQSVAIKIVTRSGSGSTKIFGRHFTDADDIYSHMTRETLDLLKANYREDLEAEIWRFVVRAKPILEIQ